MTDMIEMELETPNLVLQDPAAERAVLGAMLIDGALIPEVEEIAQPEAFCNPIHQLIYRTLIELRADGKPTEAVAVTAHLVEAGQLGRIPNNGTYLADLVAQAPMVGSPLQLAGVVADRAVLRALDEACATVRRQIRTGSGTSAEQVERARTLIAAVADGASSTDGWVQWSDLLESGIDGMDRAAQDDNPPGIPTGFHDLDRLLHGVQPGRLYVLAGRPGAGKTLLSGDLMRSFAFTHKVPTAVFNMEMTRLELFNRLMCAQAGVLHDRAVEGKLDDTDWTRIAKVCAATEDAPLWIDDTKGLTLADIIVRARRLHQRKPLGAMFIDYLGLITTRGLLPRNQEVGEIARRLKIFGGELGIPIILCAQLNRDGAQRSSKRPTLTDLADSGQIEAHADAVIFVHREEQYDADKRMGEADLIVAKWRGGATGDVVVASQLHYSRFMSMAV